MRTKKKMLKIVEKEKTSKLLLLYDIRIQQYQKVSSTDFTKNPPISWIFRKFDYIMLHNAEPRINPPRWWAFRLLIANLNFQKLDQNSYSAIRKTHWY